MILGNAEKRQWLKFNDIYYTHTSNKDNGASLTSDANKYN